MFKLKQLHAEAIFTIASSGMFSLHLSGKHTPSGSATVRRYVQYTVGGRGRERTKEMHMHESSGFLLSSREGERETQSQRFLMTPAV